MKAFVLAAGHGTRLRPITESVPKVLVPVRGVPLLDRLLSALARQGVREVALNAHHLRDMVRRHVNALRHRRGLMPLTLFEESELLGTGGGLAHGAAFWADAPLLVWNGDVVAEVDLPALWAEHGARGALATLVVQERASSSRLLVDEVGWLCGIDSPRRDDYRVLRDPLGAMRALAFHGISVLSPALQPYLRGTPPVDLIEPLLQAVADGHPVRAWDAGEGFWGTTGSTEALARLERDLGERPALLQAWTPPR
jgi:NDP-sugar pyrophosphorylase family protein